MQIELAINNYIDLIESIDTDHGISIAESNFFDSINNDWRELDYTELDAIKDNNKQAYLNELVDYYNSML